jgi:hypothetical protein
MAIGLVVIRDRELFYGPRFSRDVYSFCRILSPYRRPLSRRLRAPTCDLPSRLLIGSAARLLTLRPGQVSFIFALAFVLRSRASFRAIAMAWRRPFPLVRFSIGHV